ncbi:MAG TPA: DUF3810 family protein [Vicinamibacterales bacterium]|nr:DUF3810 family protein [Vicinamibacterales bacterium]
MRRARFALQSILILLAAAALMAPLPASLVERYYADWAYPATQSVLTSWSNQSAFSLFDVLLGSATLVGVAAWIRWVRRAWRARSAWPVAHALVTTLTLAAVCYLWFQLAWGFNYARVPLEASIGFDRARVTPAGLRSLADRAAGEVNRAYAAGHQHGFPEIGDTPSELVTALHAVERRLGRPRPTVPSRPKKTLLAGFFRASGVDGLHAPFLLETLLNPDLTPPERPAILAHEWAHLAGYAPENDASFVGLLAALRADPGSRYSAWFALFHDVAAQLPRDEQRALINRLDQGPRQDRQAMYTRLQSRIESVSRVSWQTYDQYLKAQGVDEGVENYSRVVQLLLGSGALDWQ